MKYTIRRVCGVEYTDTLHALHVLTFPADAHEPYDCGWWWLAYDENNEPVAFAGMRASLSEDDGAYLSRCGVLPGHRGRGLQRRLLRARLSYARRLEAKVVITTTYCNPRSGNNLIKAGFSLYDPTAPWGSEGTNYWRLSLVSPRASTHPDGCSASASAGLCAQ
ncbi:GNAT family N-acetyltransferase [Variovorax sp. GT1P44]|uniref:GNAT family N-acetyltransferase n=1 Tax=Variovorax sp. GT1P44 TaxID=3443742 RepID=UPI003F48A95B